MLHWFQPIETMIYKARITDIKTKSKSLHTKTET